MKTKIIYGLCFLSLAVFAEEIQGTNLNQFVTNYVESADFREVNGRTYKIQSPPVAKRTQSLPRYGTGPKAEETQGTLPPWKELSGKCVSVKKNGIVLQTFIEKKYYDTVYHPATVNNLQSIGAYSTGAGAARTSKTLTDIEYIPDQKIFVTNAPPDSANGQTIKILAMKTGTIQIDGGVLEIWDQGQQGRAAIVSINPLYAQRAAETKQQSAKIKALEYNLAQAEKGDAFGQLRMGERYRDGDAVEKDENKARQYFAKSAAQGNTDAAKALEKMKP